jgi:shikimate kinase
MAPIRDRLKQGAETMEKEKRNIILCGFMATGKSSVGKILASMLRYSFLDMDAVIEEDAGMTIPQIFSSRGESVFRALESQLVEQLAGKSDCVIATGGGTIVDPQNLENLRRIGVVISLTANPKAILSRVGSGEDRPMLAGGDKTERIRLLMEQRAEAYAKADLVVDTSSLSIEDAAKCILNLLKENGFL